MRSSLRCGGYQGAMQAGHLDGRERRICTLIAGFATSSLDGLILFGAGQHPAGDWYGLVAEIDL